MVLAGGHRQHVVAIGHHDKAGFFALQKIFNHHARACVAHFVAQQHIVDGGVGFVQRHGNDDAFARRQAVCFNHDGRAFLVHIIVRGGGVFKGLILRGGDAVAQHKGFGKIFGTFQLGGGAGGPENRQPCGAKIVHNACGKRGFGADYGKGNVFALAKGNQIGMGGERKIAQLRLGGCACVARGNVNGGDFGRLGELPCEGVFAPAVADDEQFHVLSFGMGWWERGQPENRIRLRMVFRLPLRDG